MNLMQFFRGERAAVEALKTTGAIELAASEAPDVVLEVVASMTEGQKLTVEHRQQRVILVLA